MPFVRWIAALLCAFFLGKCMTKIWMPAILGWLIGGMLLGPHGLALLTEATLNGSWYTILQGVFSIAVILAKKGFELAGEIQPQ